MNESEKQTKASIEPVLEKSPPEYHDWLRSLKDDEDRERFFDGIARIGLGDAILKIVGLGSSGYTNSEVSDFVYSELQWTFNRRLSTSISKNILHGAKETVALLLLACKSVDWRRRLLGCCEITDYLESIQNEEPFRTQVLEALELLLDDCNTIIVVYASSQLVKLSQTSVFSRPGLIQMLVDFVAIDEIPFASLYASLTILRFVLFAQGKETFAALPRVHVKATSDRVGCSQAIELFYTARQRKMPPIMWVSDPFEFFLFAIVTCLLSEFKVGQPTETRLQNGFLSLQSVPYMPLFEGLISAGIRRSVRDESNVVGEFHWSNIIKLQVERDLERLCIESISDLLHGAASRSLDVGSSGNESKPTSDDRLKLEIIESFRSLLANEAYLSSVDVGRFSMHAFSYPIQKTAVSWATVFEEMRSVGLVLPPEYEYLDLIARECFYCFPFDDLCIVLENPTTFRVHEQNRPHAEDGPAVDFNGWKIYAWHDVVVPEDAITSPESITVERIVSEEDIEVKRCLLEIYGTTRFLQNADASLIHEDEFGKLYSAPFEEEEPLLMVRVIDATNSDGAERKEYFLRVPPDMQTAKEAVAWTFGMTAEEYAPNKET